MASLAIRAQKKALRRSILASRALISAESVQRQSEQIASAVFALREFASSRSVSCFLSMDSEVDTRLITREILRTGKKLFVPRMTDPKAGILDMLRVYDTDDLDSLPAGLWGIREPDTVRLSTTSGEVEVRENAKDPNVEAIDLIIMPGVAFDTSFARLGYGKGFYDRFLESYISTPRPRPLLVALALSEQVLPSALGESVPTHGHDYMMDVIISPAFADADTPFVLRRTTT